ncbi:MAG TPA: FtsL-like putative cell division protein [Bacteroidales bacterium]|jgi:hypothetical protein|nr:FtsL-like putative cell division protein [Bacteroidales bacterium]
MAEEKAKKETKKQKNSTGSLLRELLSGSIVTEKLILSNLGYIAFITILLSFYIANRFHAEKITREMSRVQREVRDLRAEALATSADLMYVSRRSEVFRLVKERGLNLEELKTPPYRLLVNKRESEWKSGMK